MAKRIFGVSTKEQREAKRQQWMDTTPGAIATMNKAEVLSALDGLDIAEGVAEALRRVPHWRNVEALAKWDKWKGER